MTNEEDKRYQEYEEREKINLDYRKSLIEKSRLPKFLAELYYIGKNFNHSYTLTFIEKDGKERTVTGKIPVSKYSSRKDVKDFAYSMYKIVDDNLTVKSFKIKTTWDLKDWYGGSIKDRIEYKRFLKVMKKWAKTGIKIGNDKINLLPEDNRPANNVCLWDFEDALDYLIYKTTVNSLYLYKWGHHVGHKETSREIWQARKILLKIKNIEKDDEALCCKAVYEKYGVHDYDCIDYVFTNVEEFVENNKIVDALEKKSSDKMLFKLYKYFNAMADALNMPISTKEERQALVDKMEEVSDYYWKYYEKLSETRDSRLEQMWVDLSKYFKKFNCWWD